MRSQISRRQFLETAGLAAGAGFVLRGCATGKDYDLVITGGLVFDGSGGPPREADIGLLGSRIRDVGTISPRRGRAVLDVRGRAVAPGFIDVHDHTDAQLLVEPAAPSAVRQGVTSLISGQCGSSPVPVADSELGERTDLLRREFGLELTWRDLPSFFSRLEERSLGLNYGTLIGHGSVRGAAMGFDDRAPKPEEMARMEALVGEALAAGALGLSSGLEYTPGSFARPDELVALCRIVAGSGGVYATHMRDEGDRLIESLDESIGVAREAGVKLQISHFKTAYPRNWSKVESAIARVEGAQAAGVDIFCDRYPYVAGSTSLSFNFPLWAREGTTDEFLARLKDPRREAELRSALREREAKLGSWDKVVISSVLTEKNRIYEGLDVLEASRRAGRPPFEFMRDLVVEERDNVDMVIFMMSEDNLRKILAHPLVGVGADASVRSPSGPLGKGKPHPRAYGTFARALGRYARDEKVVPMEEMIKKMTSRPAAHFGLEERGAIRPGFWADLVVFDSAKVIDRATWKEPHQFPAGVEHVFVNGVSVVDGGEATGRLPGKILRRAGKA
ncbi:MAG: D-aminoacylase [Candidatus Aminicenantes bacterium]|nr:D-aminoacylase [Candidatus Aminicenantes bacterium]